MLGVACGSYNDSTAWKGLEVLLKRGGEGRLKAANGSTPAVVVKGKDGEQTVSAKHVILATGARARTIPAIGLEPDGEFIWTAKEAMVPDIMPKSLLVIGSGAIGIEFASFYRALGAEVTVVEMLDRVLPVEDKEISGFAVDIVPDPPGEVLDEIDLISADPCDDHIPERFDNIRNEDARNEVEEIFFSDERLPSRGVNAEM